MNTQSRNKKKVQGISTFILEKEKEKKNRKISFLVLRLVDHSCSIVVEGGRVSHPRGRKTL